MSITSPTVSIVMATYNRAHLIPETLDSIQNQSYPDWELVIIDDGSTDNTKEILQPYLKKDKRLQYHVRPSNYLKGLPGCRNFGLDLARGKYVIFFDDDDIVHPDNLSTCVSEMRKGTYDFCRYLREVFTGSFNKMIDRSKDYGTFEIDSNDLESIIMGEIQFNSCQVMWKKSCFTENRFNEKLQYAEEWECYSRVLADGAKGISVEKVLFYGRKHPESNTGEFWRKDKKRRDSKVEAVKSLILNLHSRNLLSPSLVKYFVNLGIFLKEKSIVLFVLKTTEAGKLSKVKYSLLFDFYPYIVWAHRLKKKFKI